MRTLADHDSGAPGELKVDTDNLHREEVFTDLRAASIRQLTPVTQDGASGRERFHLSAAIVAPEAGALAANPEADPGGRDS